MLGLTPGSPKFVVMRVTEDQDKLETKEDAPYRSGVRTPVNLSKHSGPHLCNDVRELSKTFGQTGTSSLERKVQDPKICTGNKKMRIIVSAILA